MDHTMFTCRSCLCSTNKTVSLFQKYNDEYYLPFIIYDCTGIRIDKNDNLIAEICINCADQLVAIHQFRMMFIQSDAKLRHQLFTVAAEEVIVEEDVKREFSPITNCSDTKLKILSLEIVSVNSLLKPLRTRVKPPNGFMKTITNNSELSYEGTMNKDENVTLINIENNADAGDEDGISDHNQNKELCLHSVDDIDIAGYVDVDTSYDENTFDIITTQLLNGFDEKEEKDLNSNVAIRDKIVTKSSVNSKNSLICSHCGKGFPTAQSRRVHEYVHNQGQYECTLCSRILTTAGFLRVHMQNTHNIFLPKNGTSGSKEPINETDCFCDICKMYFTEDRIARHMRTHSNKPDRPKCPLCPLTFSCTKNVQRHFKKQHTNDNTDKIPQYVCGVCHEAFYRAVEHYEHSKEHDDNCNETEDGFDLTCDVCAAVCETYEIYARHMTDQHAQVRVQPYKCRICSIRNGSKTGLYMHINCHYSNASISPTTAERNKSNVKIPTLILKCEKPYSCSFCHFKFKTARRLEEHTRVHTGEEPYTCMQCPKRFKTRITLSKHIKSRHASVREFLCSVCGKDFSTKAVLNEHMLLHTGERPYACNHCDKSFTGMSRLREHIRIHTNERPYICVLCSKAFRSHTNLRHHKISMHSVERKHMCTICGKGFKFNSSLKTHMWTHSGDDRPYNCKKCSQGFMRLKKLKLHLLSCNS